MSVQKVTAVSPLVIEILKRLSKWWADRIKSICSRLWKYELSVATWWETVQPWLTASSLPQRGEKKHNREVGNRQSRAVGAAACAPQTQQRDQSELQRSVNDPSAMRKCSCYVVLAFNFQPTQEMGMCCVDWRLLLMITFCPHFSKNLTSFIVLMYSVKDSWQAFFYSGLTNIHWSLDQFSHTALRPAAHLTGQCVCFNVCLLCVFYDL